MPTKKSATDYKWEKENCMRINMKIRNDSGIPAAIEKVKASGITKQLIADGYMPETQA